MNYLQTNQLSHSWTSPLQMMNAWIQGDLFWLSWAGFTRLPSRKKKGVLLVFPASIHFLWNVPVTWKIVYHPSRAVFLRLKPKKLSSGMLFWHLLRILNLDSAWLPRLNYVSHNAPVYCPLLPQTYQESLFGVSWEILHSLQKNANMKQHSL